MEEKILEFLNSEKCRDKRNRLHNSKCKKNMPSEYFKFLKEKFWWVKNNSLKEYLYCLKNNIKYEDISHCKICGKEIKPNFYDYKTYKKFCSEQCKAKYLSEQSEQIIQKRRETNLQRYGNPNYVNLEKQYETNMKKYGVKYIFRRPDIIEKAKQAIKNKPYFEWEKRNEKLKKTCLLKYGVDNPSKNPRTIKKIFQSMRKLKTIKLPDGTEVKCMGYEPFAYKDLFEAGIKWKDKVTTFEYFDTQANKNRTYIPDIELEDGTILEIKSTWTFIKGLLNIIDKFKAVSKEKSMKVLIYSEKGQLLYECKTEQDILLAYQDIMSKV